MIGMPWMGPKQPIGNLYAFVALCENQGSEVGGWRSDVGGRGWLIFHAAGLIS